MDEWYELADTEYSWLGYKLNEKHVQTSGFSLQLQISTICRSVFVKYRMSRAALRIKSTQYAEDIWVCRSFVYVDSRPTRFYIINSPV